MAMQHVRTENIGLSDGKPMTSLPWSFWLTRGALLLLALALVLWGAVMAARLVLAPTLVAGIAETIHAGNLTFSVDSVEWLSLNHDHDAASDPSNLTLTSDDSDKAAQAAAALGFSMPPSMMPGLPKEGQHRMRVEVTLQNTGFGREEIGPEHFWVESADGDVYRPLSNSGFRTQQLTAGQGIGVLLFIDVDQDAPAPTLVWARAGKQVKFPLSGIPGHDH